MPLPLSSSRLPPGRWAPGVRAGLESALSAAPAGAVAVFDFDETLICGDVADAVLTSLLGRMRLRLDPPSLERLLREKVAAGDETAAPGALDGALAEALGGLGEVAALGWRPGVIPQGLVGSPAHRRFALGLWQLYKEMTAAPGWGPRVAYTLHAALHGGFSPGELTAATLSVLGGDVAPAWLTGAAPIEPVPEMGALIGALGAAGVEVWVVTASTQLVVTAAATSGWLGYTLPAEQILGIRLAEDGGILAPRLDEGWPMTWGPGKVTAIERGIRAAPWLVAGDSRGDLDMLTRWDETRCRLLVPLSRDGSLAGPCARAAAGEPSYLYQPRDPQTGRWLAELGG